MILQNSSAPTELYFNGPKHYKGIASINCLGTRIKNNISLWMCPNESATVFLFSIM